MGNFPNKKSRRYKLMQLKVGASMIFPLSTSSSVRVQLAEIRRTAGIYYTTKLSDRTMKVTCIARPVNETANN